MPAATTPAATRPARAVVTLTLAAALAGCTGGSTPSGEQAPVAAMRVGLTEWTVTTESGTLAAGPVTLTVPTPAPPPTSSPCTVMRTAVRGVGEVLVTLGLVVLLAVGYQLWGKSAVVASHQDQLNQQLDQAWAGPEPATTPDPDRGDEPAQPLGPPPGDAIARLYLPTLSKIWVVVEGIGLEDIRYAHGHFPDTAMPGEIGNFSVAGHRNPATFWDLDKVDTGEPVVVETRDRWYIYRATRNHIVEPAAVEVVAPVPGDPQATASRAMLTLVTCNPKWDNTHRLIVHAELVDQQPRSGDRPELLGDLGG